MTVGNRLEYFKTSNESDESDFTKENEVETMLPTMTKRIRFNFEKDGIYKSFEAFGIPLKTQFVGELGTIEFNRPEYDKHLHSKLWKTDSNEICFKFEHDGEIFVFDVVSKTYNIMSSIEGVSKTVVFIDLRSQD